MVLIQTGLMGEVRDLHWGHKLDRKMMDLLTTG
jgi:hypothetical protein